MKAFLPNQGSPAVLRKRLRRVTQRIAPVWPLDRFVAVNPYLGMLEHPFVDAVALLQRVAGARSTMAGKDFRQLLARGELSRGDIEEALVESESDLNVEHLLHLLEAGELDAHAPEVKTVADVAGELTGRDWNRFTGEHLGAWLGSYFDQGYAAWQPERGPSLWAAWKEEAEIDRTPELMGARGVRRSIRALPGAAEAAMAEALSLLAIPEEGLDLYLHRLLMRVGGWSACAARLGWESRLYENTDDETLLELLAVLLAFEVALYQTQDNEPLASRWKMACAEMSRVAQAPTRGGPVEARVLLQRAVERRFQRKLIEDFRRQPAAPRQWRVKGSAEQPARPHAQLVFCIDVRSEVFRRHLEAVDPQVETLGFAGFFGFPVEFVPVGHRRGSAQCPVLLRPTHRVLETIPDAQGKPSAAQRRADRQLVKRAWQSFKMGAVSCFSFVGPVGLAYLPKLMLDGLGMTRPVPHPSTESLGASGGSRQVDLAERALEQRAFGISLSDRIELAGSALRGMSLTRRIARLVVLAGHGSSSVNNPHASGLDCGACGGRTGEPNVRVAAAILNDLEVRQGLRAKGIDVPEDTLFVAAQHDTTTDVVTLFNRQQVPVTHAQELADLERSLSAAAHGCRMERTARLPVSPDSPDADWFRRSRDWAQVRPEWGLAGCAAFIAAPRHRTAAIDFQGRAFLHSYEWDQDQGFSVLELIMTAPMVVASWINMQYYGSTVDPHLFGAGNKTLHNVVGGNLGVLEGNTGDLRVGLPWQSLHDGHRLQHEPIRLHVLIEAPVEAMNSVIRKHESVRHLLDNGWIHLFAMDPTGRVRQQYLGNLSWRNCDVPTSQLVPQAVDDGPRSQAS